MESIEGLKLAEEKQEKLRSLLGQVQAKACSIFEFSLGWEELNDHLRKVKIGLVEREKIVDLGEKQLEERAEKLRRWSEEVETKSTCVDEKIREFEAMKREKGSLERQIEECNLQLRSKESELASVRTELGEYNEELSAKGQKLVGLQKSLEGSRTELQVKETQLVMVGIMLDESKKSLEACNKEVAEKHEDLARVQLLVKACEAELESKERDHRSKLELTEKQLEGLQQALGKCSCEVDLKAEELGEARKALNSCVKKLESRKQDLQRTEDLIRHRLKELKSKEKELDEFQESIQKKSKELDEFQESIQKKSKELDEFQESIQKKSKELDEFQESIQKKSKELGDAVNHLDSIKELIWENSEELEKKEEQYKSMTSLIEKASAKLDLAEQKLSTVRGSIKDSLRNLELKKRHLNAITIDIEEKTKQLKEIEKRCGDAEQSIDYMSLIKSRKEDLKSIENSRNELLAKLDLEEKRLDGVKELAEQYEKDIEKKTTELKSLETAAEKYARDAELKENRLGSLDMSIKEKMKELELNQNALTSIKSAIKECNDELTTMEEKKETVRKSFDTELKLREKELNLVKESEEKVQDKLKAKEAEHKLLEEKDNSIKRKVAKYSKELESKEKELNLVSKKLQGYHENIQLTQTELITRQHENQKDGNMLSAEHLSFILKEDVRIQDCLADQVSRIITRSSDPAKLVLDTVKQFYSSILGKDRNFDSSIARSCITLLDQFMKISPPILPQVKQEAWKLSCQWRKKMRVVPGYHIEALGLLKLVAAFRLAPEFGTDDIQHLLGLASRHFHPLEFLSALGFPDDVDSRHLLSSQVKSTEIEAIWDSNAINSPFANFQPSVTTDERSLSTIISDGLQIIGLKKSEASQSLLGLQDPAEMVLNVFSTVGFGANGVRARFVFMEQLIQVSPQVNPQVKEASIPLAKRWKSCINLEDENPMEAVAFLLFLIVYGVADSFRDKDILELVMIIAQHKQAPDICWNLGFADRMPDFIRVLIQKKKHMEAARFICFFGLASEFPVEPFLKRFLEKRRLEAWISRCDIKSLEDVDWFVDRELEALTAMSSFIMELKLDFGSVVRCINDEIVKLEFERVNRWVRIQTPVPSVPQHAEGQNYRPRATTGFIVPQANAPWHQPYPQRQLQHHQKRPRMDAYSDTRNVPQASSQANLYHGAPYFHPGSGTAANYSQSTDDCVITGSISCRPDGSLEASQFYESRSRHPLHFRQ